MSEVKAFWDTRAGDPSLDEDQVTHRDVWQRWLEIETAKRYLRPADRVIDIGCGNGYGTRQLAAGVAEMLGIDYSAPMIERARAGDTPANLNFEVCDVLELAPEHFGTFDVALSFRCLINLASSESQWRAIDRIASVVRPGGRFVFVEGCADGRHALNGLRQCMGLSAMPPVFHNRDFEAEATLAYLDRDFVVEERRNFGIYDLIARVVHPLLVAPEEPQYQAPINEIAARLAVGRQDAEDLSRVLFLVLRRKGT